MKRRSILVQVYRPVRSLLFLPCFTFLVKFGKEQVDHQADTAEYGADIGDIKNRKIDKSHIDKIHDISADYPVNQIAQRSSDQ